MPKRSLFFILFLGFTSLGSSAYPQGQGPSDRVQAEREIRQLIYRTTMATLTGDAATYRRNIANRTVRLYSVVFDGLMEVPQYREVLVANKITDAEKFFESAFRKTAGQFEHLSRSEMEKHALEQAGGNIEFVSTDEAVLDFAGTKLRIIREDQRWKLDETESGKKIFLQNFGFSDAARARIENL